MTAGLTAERLGRLTLFRYAPYNAERPHPDHHAAVPREESRASKALCALAGPVSDICFRSGF